MEKLPLCNRGLKKKGKCKTSAKSPSRMCQPALTVSLIFSMMLALLLLYLEIVKIFN